MQVRKKSWIWAPGVQAQVQVQMQMQVVAVFFSTKCAVLAGGHLSDMEHETRGMAGKFVGDREDGMAPKEKQNRPSGPRTRMAAKSSSGLTGLRARRGASQVAVANRGNVGCTCRYHLAVLRKWDGWVGIGYNKYRSTEYEGRWGHWAEVQVPVSDNLFKRRRDGMGVAAS